MGDVTIGEVQTVEEGLVEAAALVVVAALVDLVGSREDDHELVEDLVVGEGRATVRFAFSELGPSCLARVLEDVQQPAELVCCGCFVEGGREPCAVVGK